MDDIEQQQRQQTTKIHSDAKELEALLSHPGWRVLRELVENVGGNYYQQLMTPLTNVDDCVRSEYAKGTLNGLQMAMGLPQSKIEESRSLRNPSHEEE